MSRDILYEMNARYCGSFGWHLKPGASFNCHRTFLPYFCMDAAYQEWLRFRRKCGGEFRREKKRMANGISEAFRAYFAKYRAMFTEEQTGFLLELTDVFEEYIAPHLAVAEVAYMNAVSRFMDFDEQKDSGSLWLVNMIAAGGQGWYGVINPKSPMGGDRMDRHIGAVLANSRDLSAAIFGAEHYFVPEVAADKVGQAVQALINVVERWVAKLGEERQAELDAESRQGERLQELLDKYRNEK